MTVMTTKEAEKYSKLEVFRRQVTERTIVFTENKAALKLRNHQI